MNSSVLVMSKISVEFPGVRALSNVDFNMERGRIYALAGANGAGKSTLMKVLSGVNSNYTGSITIDGITQEIRSPRTARNLGIETVYQEVDTALMPSLSVAENIMGNFLVNNMGRKQFLNWKHIRLSARAALNKLGVDIDVRRPVSGLSLAEKQMVLLSRAVEGRCKFLVLDEPTAPLSGVETEKLFTVVRRLAKEENTGVVFITHRLAEVFEICEHITILKDGKVVKDSPITKDLTTALIVEAMLGHKTESITRKSTAGAADTAGKDTLLEVNNVTEAHGRVKNISLRVKKGEIAGITGLAGAGKTELCKTIFGAYKCSSGTVKLKERRIRRPEDSVRWGLALVPEERRKEGLLTHLPVYINITLSSLNNNLNRFGFVSKRKRVTSASQMITKLDIKTPSAYQKTALLSGGNQQKTVVGKWLASDSEVYIFDEPAKGIDVGAKEDMYRIILDLAEKGKGIIYATSEFSELLAIADRAYVMFDGKIVHETEVKDTNEKELLYYATGGRHEE